MAKKIFNIIADLLLLSLVILTAGFLARFAWLWFYKSAFPVKYEASVLEQSEKTGVSPALLLAIIRTESGFNPNAESHVPARGLMQITDDTFEWVRYRVGGDEHATYDDMFDPETNIRYGAELLRLLQNEFGSDVNILCAYHTGWGNVKRWLQNPEYAEDSEIVSIPSSATRHYVNKVLNAEKIYKELYNFE